MKQRKARKARIKGTNLKEFPEQKQQHYDDDGQKDEQDPHAFIVQEKQEGRRQGNQTEAEKERDQKEDITISGKSIIDNAYHNNDSDEDSDSLTCKTIGGFLDCIRCHIFRHQIVQPTSSKTIEKEKGALLKKLDRWNTNILKDASDEIKADKIFISKAVHVNGRALRYASDELKADKNVVLKAVQDYGPALRYASNDLKADKEVVLQAIQASNGDRALGCASNELWANKEFILEVVHISGIHLFHASEALRSDKEVVMAAVEQEPTALQFALNGLNQDRDCLKAAGLFNEHYNSLKLSNVTRIVLSTKFSLGEHTSSYATLIALKMNREWFFKSKVVYSPNAWDKNTCDPNWTDVNFPCQGTPETCQKYCFNDKNIPIEHECCWRSSFRYQLMKAKETIGAFMVQVAEFDFHAQEHVLGNGQQIETKFAEQVGVKIFRVYEQKQKNDGMGYHYGIDSEESISRLIDELVKRAKNWYQNKCSDISVEEVRLEDINTSE